MRSAVALGLVVSLCLVAFPLSSAEPESGGDWAAGRKTVYVITVSEMIDLGLAPFVERAVEEANDDRAETIIVEIETFGGRVDSMLVIAEAIDLAKCPTVAY